jgi:EmrB/QacA subfamily drug resistance transporter
MTKSKLVQGVRKWIPLVVLALALSIIIIDTTILNVSIKAIISDLNTTVQNLQWVIAAYSLTLAAFTITGGRLGDLYGRKKMFMLGAILFAIGSGMAAIATSFPMLLAGESIVEGIGAALMMPATASLLVATYKGKDRAIAFSVWGSMAAASAAIGPILGGWLGTNYTWRWAFLINIFVAALLVVGTIVFLKESRDTEEKSDLDLVGVLLSAVGLFWLVYGFIETSTYGWWHATQNFAIFGHSATPGGLSPVPLAIGFGLLTLFAFVRWQFHQEKVGKTPLVSMKLFKNKQFVSGSVVFAVLSLGQVGLFFALPVFFQGVLGLDAFHTGLALLPLPLGIFVGAPGSLALRKKLTPKRIIQLGLAITVISTLWLRATLAPHVGVMDLAPMLFIYGVGMGFVMGMISNLTLSAVNVQQSGEASGVNNTLRNVGSTLGSAIIGAVVLSAIATNLTTGIKDSKVIPVQAKAAITQAVAGHAGEIQFGEATQSKSINPTIAKEMVVIANQATTDANKTALGLMSIFVLIALALSSQLPNVQNLEKNEKAVAGH